MNERHLENTEKFDMAPGSMAIANKPGAHVIINNNYYGTQPPKHEKSNEDIITRSEDCQRYLRAIKDKYNTIKTLLYTDTPRPFYDFYVCNDITYYPSFRFRRPNIPDIKANIKALSTISRCVILRGTGGMGKSMMMRHLLLSTVEEFSQSKIVPIFVSLKDYKDSYDSLLPFVYEKIKPLWGSLCIDQLRALFLNSQILLLLDGLDEIHSSCLDHFVKNLDSFIDQYSGDQYVLSQIFGFLGRFLIKPTSEVQ